MKGIDAPKQVGYAYHVPNAMQYFNTVLETTAFVMYDPYTFFYVFLMALGIS